MTERPQLNIGAVLRGSAGLLIDRKFLFAPGQFALLVFFVVMYAGALMFTNVANSAFVLMFEVAVILLQVCAVIYTHRYVLLGERPKIRLDAILPRYLWRMLLLYLPLLFGILLLITLAAVIIPLVVRTTTDSFLQTAQYIEIFWFLLLGLGVPVFLFFVLPAILVLPAIAAGRRDFTFRDSRQAVAGNLWRFALVGLLVIGTVVAAYELITAILFAMRNFAEEHQFMEDAEHWLIAPAVSAVMQIACACLWGGMLSFVYVQLVPQHDLTAEVFA